VARGSSGTKCHPATRWKLVQVVLLWLLMSTLMMLTVPRTPYVVLSLGEAVWASWVMREFPRWIVFALTGALASGLCALLPVVSGKLTHVSEVLVLTTLLVGWLLAMLSQRWFDGLFHGPPIFWLSALPYLFVSVWLLGWRVYGWRRQHVA